MKDWSLQSASLTDESSYKSINDLHPLLHHRVVEPAAGLVPKYIPTLQEVLDLNEGKEKCKEEKLE
jgi:hypothetical protein